MIEHGWWTPNPDLGYPFVQDSSSFPALDFIALVAVKLLTLLTHNPFISINLYYLIGFPATALAGYLLFRVARVSTWIAAILGTSIALLPWHFERFQHIFLANYSFLLIGLAVIAVVTRGAVDRPWVKPRTKWAFYGSVLAAAIVGLGGSYYAVFTALVGGLALVGQFIAGRRIRDSVRSAVVLLIVPVLLGITVLATKIGAIYAVTDPPTRAPYESELYGGKLYTLFRIAPDSIGADLIPQDLRTLAPYGEPGNGFEGNAFNNAIGLAAVVITCLLLAVALAGSAHEYKRGQSLVELTKRWLFLFVIATGLFVASGFGSVITATLSPLIRAWGRLSVMVIAIALVVLGLVMTAWLISRRARPALYALLAVMTVLTLADPVVNSHHVDTSFGSSLKRNVAPYVATAESRLPSGCPVLELPISLYPEVPPTYRSLDYSGLIPNLYSTDLRWSYGAVKTTDEGQWVKKNLDKPPAEQIALAKKAGFCALQLDMFGYPVADVAGVKATYEKLLGPPISVSNDKRWVMFRLG